MECLFVARVYLTALHSPIFKIYCGHIQFAAVRLEIFAYMFIVVQYNPKRLEREKKIQQIRHSHIKNKKSYVCFRTIICFSPPSWLFSNTILKLYMLRNSTMGR